MKYTKDPSLEKRLYKISLKFGAQIFSQKLQNVIQVPQHLTQVLICAFYRSMAKLNKYVICHVHCTQADQSSSESKSRLWLTKVPW